MKPHPLQHDHGFVAKVVQLQDIMDVRHSVMLVGAAGCGKTTVWKMLAAAHNLGKPKNKAPCIYEIVDPKAVTGNELYGFMTLSKEWRDGCLSIIMRGMSKNFKELGYGPHQTHKWVVLDGDIGVYRRHRRGSRTSRAAQARRRRHPFPAPSQMPCGSSP